MSTFRRLISALACEPTELTFGIATYEGGVITLSVRSFTANEPVTIYWGDGSFDTVKGSGYVATTHTYETAMSYTRIILVCGGNGLFRVKFDGSGFDLIDSNYKWELHPKFDKIEIGSTKTYTMNFRSLPSTSQGTNFNFVYQSMRNALFPLTALPAYATSMLATFKDDELATLPFINLPENLVTSTNAFSGCRNAVSVINKLPNTLTEAGGTFYNCAGMSILLSEFPVGLTTLENTFAYTNAEIDLDAVVTTVKKTEQGGFANLKVIKNAFKGAAKVTGSRSNFLSVCPSDVDWTGAFDGTGTTE